MKFKRTIAVVAAMAMFITTLTGCGKKPVDVSAKYTASFSIEQLKDGIKRVTDAEKRELILVPKEIEVPEEYADSMVIRTPVENAVFLSATQVCSLRAIDEEKVWDSIGGVSGDDASWGDMPAVKTRIDSGKIVTVGGDMGDPDYEKIQKINPDIIFVYTGDYPQTGVIEKLTELGLPYAVDNEYMETDYLARIEWSKFLLAFFNQEEAATAALADTQKAIDAMKKNVEGLSKPKVIFASEYKGSITVTDPKGWLGNMIKDAGADYLFADTPAEGLTLSMEDFIVKAEEADVIVYTATPSYMSGKSMMLSAIPLLADCKAVKNGQLWQYTDAFWKSIDQTAVVAQDIAAIFYPDKYADRTLTFFAKMAD